MKYGYVYLTTNLRNQILIYYIGQRTKSGFDNTYFGSGKKIVKSVNKFGGSKFRVKILSWAKSKKELDFLEEKSILRYRQKYGIRRIYNIAKGGGRGPFSKEDRIKFGKVKRTKKWCENISKALKGREISEEWCKNLSEAHKGFKMPEAQRKKRSISNKRFWAYVKTNYLLAHSKRSSKANKGRKHSNSTKMRTSQNMKKMWRSASYRNKMLTSRIGKQISWNKGLHIPWTLARRNAYEMNKL